MIMIWLNDLKIKKEDKIKNCHGTAIDNMILRVRLGF